LHERLGVERPTASARNSPVTGELRDEIDGLRALVPFCRVGGKYDGSGVVVRSEDPVDFHPDGRVVNVIPVGDLADAARHVNVATQTVGVYPDERKTLLRDQLAAMGTQRVVKLGSAGAVEAGIPHDGFLPLHRFVRWINDEG
jgi:hypothetical protein